MIPEVIWIVNMVTGGELSIGWPCLVMIEPGVQTGKFRLGKDEPVFYSKGESKILIEDYAVALVDEIEKPQFIRQRFTIGF